MTKSLLAAAAAVIAQLEALAPPGYERIPPPPPAAALAARGPAAAQAGEWDVEKAAKAVVSLAERSGALAPLERRRLQEALELLDSLTPAQLDRALMLGELRALRAACRAISRESRAPSSLRDLAESVESKL